MVNKKMVLGTFLKRTLTCLGFVGLAFFCLFASTVLKPIYVNVMSYFETYEQAFIVVGGFGTVALICLYQVHFFLIYSLNLPFFEQFKITNEPWPWEEDQEKWRMDLLRSAKLFALTMLSMITLTSVSTYAGMINFQFDEISYPGAAKNCAHLMFCVLIDDSLLYWLHRAVHLPLLYEKFHKPHHTFKNTISLTTFAAHPFEFFFVNNIGYLGGALLIGKSFHFITFILWSCFKVYDGTNSHCGYEFPWMPLGKLPFTCGSDWHDYHHSHNSGNFGSFFFFWDKLMGTDKNFHLYKKRTNKY